MGFLDLTGLTTFWNNVKDYIDDHKATVTQTLTSGTEIGSVDGTKLYAPAGGSGGSQTTWYGTCSTAAGTAAKVVTCTGFTLKTGCLIGIYFSTGNTANTLTLNVNGTGAKAIWIGSTPLTSEITLKWSTNTVLLFMYDGTRFRYITSKSSAATVTPQGAGGWYGTSSTAAGTTAKVVSCTNYQLKAGNIVAVHFSTANTAAAPTLNVGGTGAKNIYVNGSAVSSSNPLTWSANTTLVFSYNGSYYYYLGSSRSSGGGSSYTLPIASSSTLGGVKVGSGLSINSSGVLSVDNGGTMSEWHDFTNDYLELDPNWSSVSDLSILVNPYAGLVMITGSGIQVSSLTFTANLTGLAPGFTHYFSGMGLGSRIMVTPDGGAGLTPAFMVDANTVSLMNSSPFSVMYPLGDSIVSS